MASPPPDPHDRRQLERLNAFSDGVFAISITLLVLAIEVPKVDADSLGAALSELGPDIGAYFLGFAVIGLFWYGHSNMFSYLTRATGLLTVVNLMLLAMISLMPFTTSVLGSFENEPLAVAIYAANVGGATSLDSLVDQVALRSNLYKEGAAPDPTQLGIEGILRPTIFLLSVPLAFVSITLAQLSWLLLFATPQVAERLARLRRKPDDPT